MSVFQDRRIIRVGICIYQDSLLVHLNDLEESMKNIKTMNYSCLKNISKIDFIKYVYLY